MGFFRDLKNNYKDEFINEPKNSIDWSAFHTLRLYDFLVYCSDGKRPIQLTQNEVLNLYKKLYNEYKTIHGLNNEDGIAFNKIKTSGNWKKLYSDYPVHYLGYVLMLLSSLINKAYEDTQVEFSFEL
tara:strand:+ start:72 stop:452 length:381 start_codon:yes stop_codon:yes gene_type:complete